MDQREFGSGEGGGADGPSPLPTPPPNPHKGWGVVWGGQGSDPWPSPKSNHQLTHDELTTLCDRITAATGVTMALEGIYRWLVFLPSTQQEGRPVPNRYFGVFTDGTLRYRGLMCRRRDTPPLVRRAQEAVLARLSQD